MKRRIFLKGVLGASAWWVVGTSAAQNGPSTTRPFTVGTTVSRTGRYSSFAKPIEQALVLWADEVEGAGGFGGRGVKLRILDDASDPVRAEEAFRELARDADALIAPYGSRLTEAVLPVVEQAEIPCIAPSAGSRRLWEEPRRWLVQLLNPIDTTFASTLALAAGRGVSSVALLHRDDAFSDPVMDGASRHATEAGLQVSGRYRYDTSEEAMSAMRSVDAELLLATGFRSGGQGFGFLDDALMLHAAFRTVRSDVRLASLGIGAADREFGTMVHMDPDGVLGTTGWRPYLPTPGNRSFISSYTARWGDPPDTHSAQAHAAGEVLEAAFRVHVDGEADTLRDALFALDIETVFGRYRVDDSGLQIGKTNAVVQWRGREPGVVYPDRYATAGLQVGGGDLRRAMHSTTS